MAISLFNNAVIEQLSKILADTQNGFTGSEIGLLLAESNIPDIEKYGSGDTYN